MEGLRALELALAIARERLQLLQAGDEFPGLEELDAALAAACEAAGRDLRPGDGRLVDELLAIHAAADRLIDEELAALGGRMRRLREGQVGSAAYRASR